MAMPLDGQTITTLGAVIGIIQIAIVAPLHWRVKSVDEKVESVIKSVDKLSDKVDNVAATSIRAEARSTHNEENIKAIIGSGVCHFPQAKGGGDVPRG